MMERPALRMIPHRGSEAVTDNPAPIFLKTDLYYTTDFTREYVAGWTATGSVAECVEHLLVYRELGFDEVTLRITAWDQFGQLKRVLDEVIPRVADQAVLRPPRKMAVTS